MARRREKGFWGGQLLVCGTLVLIGAEAGADQWYVEPRVYLQALADDNVRLSASDPESSTGTRLVGDVEAGRRTEDSEIALGAQVFANQYWDASDLDDTDGRLRLSSAQRIGQNRFGLDAAFDYDSTLTSEIETTGYVQVNKRRRSLQVNPYWKYTLTDRIELATAFGYQNVSYEDVDLLPIYDYSLGNASVSVSYRLTERHQVFGRLSYDQYEADEVDVRSENRGAEIGSSYLFTERTSLTAYAGVRNTHAEEPGFFWTVETDNTGPIFELELRHKYDRGELRIGAERSMAPSSNGTLLDTTGLSVAWDYQFAPRWRFSVSGSGYTNRAPDGESSTSDRDYLSFQPSLRRDLTETLSLDLGYRYRWQEYELGSGDASSNAVFLTFVYGKKEHTKWSVLGN